MEQARKIVLRPSHRIDVGDAARYLLVALKCDDWYVACQHDHLLVIQLSQAGTPKYAVRFECSAPVEKAVYHGSKSWEFSIIPLHDQPAPSPAAIGEIEAGLAQLS